MIGIRGAIEGIELDKSSQLWSCDSCEYAKATRKPIRKVRETPQASEFGEEKILIYGELPQSRRLERRSIMRHLRTAIHGGLTLNYSIRRMKCLMPIPILRHGRRPSLGLGVSKGSELTVEAST